MYAQTELNVTDFQVMKFQLEGFRIERFPTSKLSAKGNSTATVSSTHKCQNK
jgi:hypothetical protein